MKVMSKKKDKKVMYYYHEKFPEWGIDELPLEDIRYIKSVVNGRDLYLHSVTSYLNIETMTKGYFPSTYELCDVYGKGEVYHWSNRSGNIVVLSFNKELLSVCWKKDCKATYNKLKDRLKELENARI